MKEIEQYIKKIVDHTDCSKEEKEDLAEELTVHLEILTEENIKLGMSEQEAVQEAIRIFGSEHTIGEQLQQAMFPYRRELLVTISLSFIALTFAAYSVYLFYLQEASNIELLINVLIGLGLLTATVSQTFNTKRKLIINSLLVMALLGSVMNSLMLAYTDHYFTQFLLFLNYGIMLAIIVMLYITTMHSAYFNKPFSRLQKLMHFVNITVGLVILAATLFFVWGILLFGGMRWGLTFIFIPLVIWLILYIIQVKLQNKILIHSIFALYVLFVGAILLFFLYPYILM
ncbi:MAG: permease prefix domain 1-containing protein [Bacillus sp. (in: firmicutes)]